MTDFKVVNEDRIYTMFLESSQVGQDTVEAKVIMYSTVYNIYKTKEDNTWHNHISKFELSPGLLKAVGAKLDEYLKL